MAKWQWILLQVSRRLWVRAVLIGVLGIGAAVLASLAEAFLPWQLGFDIGADAVDSLLSIIASSMLAVTTFSLSVMTSAFSSATSNVTPRATKLLIEDRLTQNVLSTFIGSFLFSIVGLVVLKAGAYGAQGRAVLFLVTIFVLALIVISLLRWIDHLTRLGRVGETTDRVENAARDAIVERLANPSLGGAPLDPERPVPDTAVAIRAHTTGYVQHVDTPRLSACAEQVEGRIDLAAIPGHFVYRGSPLARIEAEALPEDEAAREALEDSIRQAFTVADTRSFDQDPRFGFVVLCEIASRALSPGINDPGTAIDVIGRATRLLTLWAEGSTPRDSEDIAHPRVFVPPLQDRDLFDDAFNLLARDGAGNIEVQLRLRKALRALGTMGSPSFQAAAHEQARRALKRAELAMTLEDDLERLRGVRIAPAAAS